MYLSAFGYCIKFELFPEGNIALDATDQNCLNEVHTPSLVVSKFDKVVDNRATFVKAGPSGYSGTLDFKKDNTVTELSLVPRKLENQQFVLGVNVPSCNQGPIYPVFYQKVHKTLYLPVGGQCYRVELFGGGAVAVDTTDPACSNSFTEQGKIATFNSGHGNEVLFDKFGATGLDGTLRFFRDITLTGTDIQVNINSIAGGTFDISLTLPMSLIK